MADTAKSGDVGSGLPLDVTWDDVRKSQKSPRWRQILPVALFILAAVTLVYSLWFPASEKSLVLDVAVPTTTPVAVAIPIIKTVKSASKSGELCRTLFGWSANTILELGPSTRARCRD